MDMRAKTCCFTGHRSLSGAEKLKVAVRLRKAIKELVKQGIVFYGVEAHWDLTLWRRRRCWI